MAARLVLTAASCAAAGCVDPLAQETSRIDGPRVLAVIATPAEAAPGTPVRYVAVAADATGPLATPTVAWAHCAEPKPPTEDNVVAPACVDDPAVQVALGDGAAIDAAMPGAACSLYGPDTPPGGFRPRDPDPSGGYYQPVRATLPGAPIAFGLHRITCGLADAPPALVREYRERYRANQHPALTSLVLERAGAAGEPPTATAAETLDLVVTWPPDAAEAYVRYDRAAAAIVDQREAMRVSWYATSGALAADATGVAAGDAATSTRVAWTAPSTPGPTHVWAVLRDDRGGVATAAIEIAVVSR